jgi:hypothetical protein
MTDRQDAIEKVLRLLNDPYGSHGINAMKKVITALIQAGVTSAACGSLDRENCIALQSLLDNPDDLDKVARIYWWGEEEQVIE